MLDHLHYILHNLQVTRGAMANGFYIMATPLWFIRVYIVYCICLVVLPDSYPGLSIVSSSAKLVNPVS